VEEEREATGGLLPTDRQVVVERFRDELGDWRVAILSPFGARVHAPWGLAIETRLRRQMDVEAQAIWSDDGIIVRLPEAEEAPAIDSVLVDPDELEELVVDAVGSSALFAARFRENAARALLLPRRRPGSRTPLWQLRQRAADLLEVASKYGSFPVLLETYRECLRDVFDLPALTALLRDIQARRVRVAEVELQEPSPFASGLVYSYVAQFMYEGDAPLAEKRAQALTLDRRMLAQLLGTDELRELIDAGVLTELEAELQALAPDRQASGVEAAADLLRRLGDLSHAEMVARCAVGLGDEAWDTLAAGRRAVVVRVAGEERMIAAEDAGRYRDALGVVPPPGLPQSFLEPVEDALVQLVRRWARVHGPFVVAEPAARFGVGVDPVRAVLTRLEAEGRLSRGAFRPGGSGRDEWCDTDVLRVLRQRSLAALRKEVEPAEVEALGRFLPAWHGVAPVGVEPPAGGIDRLYEVVAQLEGFAIPASVLESDVLAPRVRGYDTRMLDELVGGGEVMWVGAGSLAREDGRVVLVRRDVAPLLLPRLGLSPAGNSSPAGELSGPLHERIRSVLAERGACFFRELGASSAADRDLIEALWDLVWAGEVTCDGMAALRATVGSARPRRSTGAGSLRHRARPGSVRALGPPRGQGRWSLLTREIGDPVQGTAGSTQAGVTLANSLLERHGILTRDSVRAEAAPGGYAGVYPVLKAMAESGRIRRGYFVAGMGGAQFALPGAVDRLRAERSGVDRGGPGASPAVTVLAATDPANVFGMAVPWPVRGPSRVAGAYVVLVDGLASAYLERGGKGIVALRDCDGTWEEAAVGALAHLVSQGRWRRLALQRFPEDMADALRGAGFVPTPKGLVRYA